MSDPILKNVEQQRLQLEENIAKFRKALRHWQSVEIDYEGLKEEFMILPEDASYDACYEAARSFQTDVIDEKDIQSLLGEKGIKRRRPQQLVDLLSKRGEYVLQNIETLRKQLSNAEKARNALLLAEDPDYREDAGLPLTEITEELDDTGQVIATKIETPGTDIPHLVEALKKSGVHDFEKPEATSNTNSDDRSQSKSNDKKEVSEKPSSAETDQSLVNESEDVVQQEDNVAKPSPVPDSTNVRRTDTEMEKVTMSNLDDTEEEAALRQEMLSYGLDEVGAIVAELELEENASDVSDENDYADFENDSDFDDDELDDDESEDETGKAKGLRISDKYRRKMEEMQKKLGINDVKNLGPSPNLPSDLQEQLDRPPAAQAAAKAAIARQNAVTKSSLKNEHRKDHDQKVNKPKTKKKVAFAQTIDVAKESSTPKRPPGVQQSSNEDLVRPIEETIIERTGATNSRDSQPSNPNKVSKFKQARTANSQTSIFSPLRDFPDAKSRPPEGPPGKVISDTLVERDTSKEDDSAPLPPDPNDIDEEMHRREIAMEYYKMRNKRIHQQGGFIGDGESDNYGEEFAPAPIEDDLTGKTRKVSRFKAARVKP